LGLERKVALGPWFVPALRLLRALKGLRGTALDPFGYAEVRREERRLVGWYTALVDGALARLDAGPHATAVEVAGLPDAIRGYEATKLESARVARSRAEALVARLGGAPMSAAPGA